MKNLKADFVIGLQFGDEGKGKVIDSLLSSSVKYDGVVRGNGADNAGHQIVIGDKKFTLHSLPSGVLQPVVNIIGPGCVVNPNSIEKEIDNLGEHFIGTLVISERCPLIMKRHVTEDHALEAQKGENSVGTTLKGVGPAYASLKNRTAVFAGDLHDIPAALERFLYLEDNEFEDLKKELTIYASKIGQYVKSIKPVLRELKHILVEGAQATMLDNLYGTYPYVTSSSTTVPGLLMGIGLNHTHVGKVYGVMKPYSVRVGNGPFVTEMEPDMAHRVRVLGNEVGSTTGRDRRCGWTDFVQLQEAVVLNGVTDLCLMKSDVLDSFDEVQFCTAYKLEPGVTELVEYLSHVPFSYKNIEPYYDTFMVWDTELFGKTFTRDTLPIQLSTIITFIEQKLDVPVTFFSTGPERDQTSFL